MISHKLPVTRRRLSIESSGFSGVRILLKYGFRFASVFLLCMGLAAQQPIRKEPISYIGHGAMFDQSGREVAPTPSFIRKAQAWYRAELMAKLTKLQSVQFREFERGLTQGLTLDEQSQLVVNTHLLDWLIDAVDVQNEKRIRGKNNLIKNLLKTKLSNIPDVRVPRSSTRHDLNPVLLSRLTTITDNKKKRSGSSMTTDTGGEAYRTKCEMEGVPVPPNFGGPGWQRHGQIPQENLFIIAGLRAEIFTYQSSVPEGMCAALPRFTEDDTVILDGVICLGKVSSKVCFWDNEKNAVPFQFQLGDEIPFDSFGGGIELIGDVAIEGAGGVCSDCHSGENPYIIHPDTVLGTLRFPPLDLPTFANNRHDPIVRSGDTFETGAPLIWPENLGSTLPTPACDGCHTQGGSAGRLGHLSTELPGYCGIVRTAIGALAPPLPTGALNPTPTMPLGAAGSLACTPGLPSTDARYRPCSASTTVTCTPGFAPDDERRLQPDFPAAYQVRCTPQMAAVLNLCGISATVNVAGRGDPHITTVDGTNYDFQSAGEFVYLRSGDGLEIQTRQKPIATTFNPGPNQHTGLASCVSVNTAVAARVGQHRVTFQSNVTEIPAPGVKHGSKGSLDPSGLELRIDGQLTTLSNQGIDLGDGGRIVKSVVGRGIEIYFPDKTHLIATPNFWADQNTWYMNVDVLNTPGRDGILGVVSPGGWLPSLPDGSSLGPKPFSVSQRFFDLNQTFADAWRVNDHTSLFDYFGGTSTTTFTNRGWPPESGPCIIPESSTPPARPMDAASARELCSVIVDTNMNAECVFDLTVTGEAGFAHTYLLTQQLVERSRRSRLVKISKAFLPQMIQSGGISTVTVTLGNGDADAVTNAAFTDSLHNMQAVGGPVGGTCVGTTPNTLLAGATNLSFSGITIPARGSCTVTFGVTSNSPGLRFNTVSGVTSTEAATSSESNPATLIVVAPPIVLSPEAVELPVALVNTPYSQTFTATGGCAPPFTYAVTSGALPPGFTLSTDGVLSGTALQPGDFSFSVTATDSCASSETKSYTLKVRSATNIVSTKTLVISAFRENGPNGAGDEFVEIFNPTDASITVSDLSGDPNGAATGIGVFSNAGNNAGTASNGVFLRCQIPGSAVIKSRGWYLCGGSSYSLSNLGLNGGTAHSVPDTTIGTGNATPGDIPDDAGLVLLNIGTNIVTACQGFGCPSGFNFSDAGGSGNATVFDKVGFRPYGSGAPGQVGYPSLASQYCEGLCLQPVGDASTITLTPGSFACPTAVGPPSDPSAFPVQAGGFVGSPGTPICYGESGQYKIDRRRSAQQFDPVAGNLHRDTDNNADDFILDAPNPATGNVGLTITGTPGVFSVLGVAGPHNSIAPPITGAALYKESGFDNPPRCALCPPNAERHYPALLSITNPQNDPLGVLVLRRRFTNASGLGPTGARYRIDDLSTLCGGQAGINGIGSTVGTQEARNLRGPDFTVPPATAPIPSCQGEGSDAGLFTAILKAVNHYGEIVVDGSNVSQLVLGAILEDTSIGGAGIPAVGRHQPLGGGSNSSFVTTSALPLPSGAANHIVGDGVNGGIGTFATSGTVRRIAFKFGVVKSGRFKLLIGPEVEVP